ncbi:hypothetical protein IWW38_002232 [Coemansia aciculifera]|uniref:Uncharacterized protein n=1 Tax=Coemansia aciculifera TaxID=417176 RepID=A0ACC1M529_9FUNG|nr:hypothetical protein IWW38_002232 [Coemansia aciculifera]
MDESQQPVNAKSRDAMVFKPIAGAKNSDDLTAVHAAEPETSTPASKDPLGGTKPPETLATCEINRDSSGRIRPVCKFIRQLPIVPSFAHPFSAVRRTVDGNSKFERAGIFKDLTLKGRLANVYDISAGRCVSHNRDKKDIASCQRDPNNPEFFISIDGLTPVEARERADIAEGSHEAASAADSDIIAEKSLIHNESSKLPDVNVI